MGISSRYHAFCCLFQIDQKLFTFPGLLPKWVSVTQRLTQAFVHGQAANGRDRIIFDSQVPGLGLRITPTGTRIFIAQGRVAGRKRRITVGFADRMPLSEARTEALQLLAVMRRGVDPTEDRKARLRAAQAESITIRELSEQWMAEFVIPSLSLVQGAITNNYSPAISFPRSAISLLRRSIAAISSSATSPWPARQGGLTMPSPLSRLCSASQLSGTYDRIIRQWELLPTVRTGASDFYQKPRSRAAADGITTRREKWENRTVCGRRVKISAVYRRQVRRGHRFSVESD